MRRSRAGPRSPPAATRSSTRRPAPARRSRPSSGASTDSPPSPRPGPATRVLYISPLKALAYDIERNLRAPLAGIAVAAERLGLPAPIDLGGDADRRHAARPASAPHRAAAGHPRHHARVAVPAAHERRARGASRTWDTSSSTRSTPSPAPSAVPTSRSASSASNGSRRGRRSGSACRRRSARSRRSRAFLGGDRAGSRGRHRRRRHRKRLELRVVVPVEDLSRLGEPCRSTSSRAAPPRGPSAGVDLAGRSPAHPRRSSARIAHDRLRQQPPAGRAARAAAQRARRRGAGPRPPRVDRVASSASRSRRRSRRAACPRSSRRARSSSASTWARSTS